MCSCAVKVIPKIEPYDGTWMSLELMQMRTLSLTDGFGFSNNSSVNAVYPIATVLLKSVMLHCLHVNK